MASYSELEVPDELVKRLDSARQVLEPLVGASVKVPRDHAEFVRSLSNGIFLRRCAYYIARGLGIIEADDLVPLAVPGASIRNFEA
jgi:hypothetical protein